jgi:F0F1-type ATP synthase membrane subunit c/vacuolar-type H+-ATPase subunit K
MAQGSGFANTAGNIGTGLGNFIGGLVNPALGGQTQTSVTVTEKPIEDDNNNTIIIIAVVASVVIISAVLYFVFKR